MSTPRPAALALHDVGLQIGGARILEGVSFEVAPGEMVGVIGPNGAGKTTLFNLISGVLKPTSGDIAMDGKSLASMTIHRRAAAGLGRTFKTSSLFTGLRVEENVRIAAQAKLGGSLSILRFPRAGDEAGRIAANALDEVELQHKAGTRAGDLSHGDKRKVEIAMLLATSPSVILLDEPMAGIGSGDLPGLSAIISRMHREAGHSVLMVEHHMEVILGLVDRVAVMHYGTLLAIDTPEAVIANPLVRSAYLGETVQSPWTAF